jgi:transcriptional regulator with XRE-family HTH domain
MSTRKKSARIAKRIKSVRLEKGRTQQAFATVLGVRQNLVSAWERGLLPSAENYVALGNVAEKHEDRLFFWGLAGMDRNAFLSALSTQEKKMHVDFDASEAVLIEPVQGIGSDNAPMKFPRWMVKQPAATRYALARFFWDTDDDLVREGDVILIDVSEVNIDKLADESLIAVLADPSNPHFVVGMVRRSTERTGDTYVWLDGLRRPVMGLPLALKVSGSQKSSYYLPDDHREVMGRVIGWISGGKSTDPRYERSAEERERAKNVVARIERDVSEWSERTHKLNEEFIADAKLKPKPKAKGKSDHRRQSS